MLFFNQKHHFSKYFFQVLAKRRVSAWGNTTICTPIESSVGLKFLKIIKVATVNKDFVPRPTTDRFRPLKSIGRSYNAYERLRTPKKARGMVIERIGTETVSGRVEHPFSNNSHIISEKLYQIVLH